MKTLIIIFNNTWKLNNSKIKILNFIIVVFVLLTYAQNSYSQTIDEQLWMNYTIKFNVNEKFYYGGDLGIRGLFSNQDWIQFLIRPAVNYRFNAKTNMGGAIALFKTFNKDDYNVYEFRIHQELNIKWPKFNMFSLFWRVRIEERFFYFPNQPTKFRIRDRLLGGIQTKDITLFGDKHPIYFLGILEAFDIIGNNNSGEFYNNQSRLHAAFGHKLSPFFRYEIHYIWQRSRLLNEDGLQTHQHIIRLRFFHEIGKKY